MMAHACISDSLVMMAMHKPLTSSTLIAFAPDTSKDAPRQKLAISIHSLLKRISRATSLAITAMTEM